MSQDILVDKSYHTCECIMAQNIIVLRQESGGALIHAHTHTNTHNWNNGQVHCRYHNIVITFSESRCPFSLQYCFNVYWGGAK